jgi:protein O-GlcNAc transferase
MDRYKKVIEESKQKIALNSADLQAYQNWRDAIKNLTNPEQELAEYESTLDRYLATALDYIDFGNLLFDLTRYEKAIEQYKKATLTDKNNYLAHYNWGLSLDRLEKYEEAIIKYKKVIELNGSYETRLLCLWFGARQIEKT